MSIHCNQKKWQWRTKRLGEIANAKGELHRIKVCEKVVAWTNYRRIEYKNVRRWRHTMYNSVNNMEDKSLMLFSSYSHAPFLVDRCLVCVCSFWIGSVKKEILPIRYSLSWANCFFEIKYSIIRNKMHSLLPCQTSIAWRAIFIPICTLHCTFLFTIKSFASF